jgi:hypothetical protein
MHHQYRKGMTSPIRGIIIAGLQIIKSQAKTVCYASFSTWFGAAAAAISGSD